VLAEVAGGSRRGSAERFLFSSALTDFRRIDTNG
jgi:hypothetical protein